MPATHPATVHRTAARWPRIALSAALVAALAACAGPVPVEQAERSCLMNAAQAGTAGPRSRVTMGVVARPGGIRPHAGLEVGLSGAAIAQRDPAEAYARCVLSRSGQPPMRSYYDMLGISAP